jgi:Beta-ketoacyl synthase, N-terminal domain
LKSLSAFIDGIGLIGPGLANWAAAREVLSGARALEPAATQIPQPTLLPPAERRRTGRVVNLALAVGLEATQQAEANAASLRGVFASSGGDGDNCHAICETLASADRQLSPTRFHNSVHNVTAGYWSIATRDTEAASVISAYDGSFAAGLLEALTQLAAEPTDLLCIAYDVDYPPPLREKRPIPAPFGVALLLRPERTLRSLAAISASIESAAAQSAARSDLEGLRRAIPAARSLPMLELIARGESGSVALEYLQPLQLTVKVVPCR